MSLTGSTPVDVMVRAMGEICDEPDIECLVICRTKDRKLKYFSNMQFISEHMDLLRCHQLFHEEQYRAGVLLQEKEGE
jgi:hypothetical protein